MIGDRVATLALIWAVFRCLQKPDKPCPAEEIRARPDVRKDGFGRVVRRARRTLSYVKPAGGPLESRIAVRLVRDPRTSGLRVPRRGAFPCWAGSPSRGSG